MELRKAFTLVELLVVVAIITILAAVLFPVLATAREKGRQTACLSNEKQLALAILMYAQDYDEILLPTATTDGILWPVTIDPYVKSSAVRMCPSDATDTVCSYGLNELNFSDLTDAGALPPQSLAKFQTPANTVMLGELGVGTPGNFADLSTPRVNAYKLTIPTVDLNDDADARPSARHFSRADIALMDGHIQAMRLEQFYVDQTPPDKWFTP